MSTVETPTLYTPEDLLTMPDGDLYELVDGKLVERNMGAWSSYVGTRLLRRLGNFSEDHFLGWVFGSDASYQCFPHRPRLVRKPDISFIRLGRLPGERAPQGHTLIAPDLAVEVISPNDLAYDIDERVADFLAASTRLVWVVNPVQRTVLIYRHDGSIAGVREGGELDGEDAVPGFRCPVHLLFVTPAPPTAEPGGTDAAEG
jgi:Uma2 family endonuclease